MTEWDHPGKPSGPRTGKAVLVTGACGEIGQALIQNLSAQGGYRIVTADASQIVH